MLRYFLGENAKGSGTSVNDVNMMLEEYKKLKGVIENIGKANLPKGNDIKMLQRNPK